MRRAFIIATVFAGITAMAMPAQAELPRRYARMDTNGDQQISFDEYAAFAKAEFIAADGNKDGSLNSEERHEARRRRHEARRAQMRQRADKDGDGLLSRREVQDFERERAEHMRRQILSGVDQNGDGKVSETEKDAARRALTDARRPRGRPTGPPRENRPKLDSNGMVSWAQIEANIQRQFEQRDFDKDGYVTTEEIRRFDRKRRDRRRERRMRKRPGDE